MSRLTYAWPVVLLVAAVAACTSGVPGDAASTGARPSPSGTPTSSRSPSPSLTPSTSAGRRSAVSLRCGGDDAPDARLLRLKAPGGAVLTAFDVGGGTTAAVFLHQTNGGGFCGWWPYGSWLSASAGVRAVGLDLCGYGTSRCPQTLQDDPVRQVEVVVDWLRAKGAERVVVVGASLGGSVALDAAAALDVDAVVDLSGPVDYPTTHTTRSLPRLRVPTLVAVSRSDDPTDHDVLQRALPRIPAATKRFVSADGGHGYALVWGVQGGVMGPTPFATTVADWVRGRYTT